MHRSVASIGLVLIVVGLGLAAFPVVVLGREQLDLEQVTGFLLAPVGLFVVMIAASSGDPRRTTVSGTFGNPEEVRASAAGVEAWERTPGWSPLDAVHCRFCRTVITSDLASCPRCARARDCRNCGRPLGMVLDRPTCPTCARAEAFCDCPTLGRHPGARPHGARAEVGI